MSATVLNTPLAPTRPRLSLVDAARGTGLLLMGVYHASWDLWYLRLAELDVAEGWGWRTFARAVASIFLLLVGVSLTLATRNGFASGPFLRRLGILVLAAGAITAATYWLFPGSFIFFGILHCIAASSVLALAFLRVPAWGVGLAALACFAAPFLFAHPFFDHPALQWLGLVTVSPTSNDYVPLLPWFGVVLLGLLVGRLLLRPQAAGLAGWRPRGALGRWLGWAGRHSLPIYLIHQPILFGLLWLVAVGAGTIEPGGILGSGQTDAEQAFGQSCRATCEAAGREAAVCAAACDCVLAESQAAGVWPSLLAGTPTAEERQAIDAIVLRCRAAAEQ